MVIGRSFTDAPGVDFWKRRNELTFIRESEEITATLDHEDNVTSTLYLAETLDMPIYTINLIEASNDPAMHNILMFNHSEKPRRIEKKETSKVSEVKSLSVCAAPETKAFVEHKYLVVSEDQPESVAKRLLVVLNDFRDSIALDTSKLGCIKIVEMQIHGQPSRRPVHAKLYRSSQNEREEIRFIVQDWTTEGLVTKADSRNASPVLLGKKKTGENCLLVDFCGLNTQIERTHFPLPDPMII